MKKALVIDDDVDILYLIKDILEDDGYEVVISNSAEEAYIKLNDDIDIVLLDVMMPGTDGFSFCKKIRDEVEIPIIFLTAKTSEEDIYEKVWGYDAEGDSATVSEHIKKIRAKFLKINKEFDSIQTVWGIGYKFKK